MAKTQDSRIQYIQSTLHRDAEALLRMARQNPVSIPSQLNTLLQEIITYATGKSNQAKPHIDNLIDSLSSAIQDSKKSSPPINHEIFTNFHSIQFFLHELRYLQEIKFREEKISVLSEKVDSQNQKIIAIQSMHEDLSNKIPGLENLIAKKIESIDNDYQNFVNLIKTHTKNATTLFDLSSIESTEKIYGLRSTEESRMANEFRKYSLMIMGGIAFIDIIFLWKGLVFGFQPLDAFSTVALSLLLLTPSIYLSKESNKHRKFEQQNLKIQQNIAAVMSVTSTMSEDDKKQIKQAITTALLENIQAPETDESSPSVHFNISEKLLSMFKST